MLRISRAALRRAAVLIPLAAIVAGAGLWLAGLATAADTTASDTPQQPHDKSVVRRCSGGRALRIRPGDCLVVTARGFVPGEVVLARLLSDASRRVSLRADRSGAVAWRYRVGAGMHGRDVATFVGQGNAAQPATDTGTVMVTVPRIAVVRYTVR